MVNFSSSFFSRVYYVIQTPRAIASRTQLNLSITLTHVLRRYMRCQSCGPPFWSPRCQWHWSSGTRRSVRTGRSSHRGALRLQYRVCVKCRRKQHNRLAGQVKKGWDIRGKYSYFHFYEDLPKTEWGICGGERIIELLSYDYWAFACDNFGICKYYRLTTDNRIAQFLHTFPLKKKHALLDQNSEMMYDNTTQEWENVRAKEDDDWHFMFKLIMTCLKEGSIISAKEAINDSSGGKRVRQSMFILNITILCLGW